MSCGICAGPQAFFEAYTRTVPSTVFQGFWISDMVIRTTGKEAGCVLLALTANLWSNVGLR